MLSLVVIVDSVVDCNKNDDDDVLSVEFEKVFCVDVPIVVAVDVETAVLVNVELSKLFDGVFVDCNSPPTEVEYGMFSLVDVDNDTVSPVLGLISFVVAKMSEVDISALFTEEETNSFCFDVPVTLLIALFVVSVVDIRSLSVLSSFNEELIIGFVISTWGMSVDSVVLSKNKNNFYATLLYSGNIKNINI